MDYRFIVVFTLLDILSTLTSCLPVTPSNNEEETVAVYVPYDVKYIPVEVPDKLLNVEPLNSKNSDTLEPLVLKKEDILKHLNDEEGNNTVIKPVLLSDITEKGAHKQNQEGLVTVPLSTIADAVKAKETSENNLEILPLVVPKENSAEESHKVSKRQIQRFPYYRPVFRFSRLSSNRRQFDSASRNHAMVGYLNDRDYFPTVA